MLDIADDSDIYLSEIDNLPEKVKPNLKSVIVKPLGHSQNSSKNHVVFNKKTHRALSHRHRSIVAQSPHTRFEPGAHTIDNRHVVVSVPNHKPNSHSSDPLQKKTETRGTQTERTGACKCARALQQRNKRRRVECQQNKQVINTLKVNNIVEFVD